VLPSAEAENAGAWWVFEGLRDGHMVASAWAEVLSDRLRVGERRLEGLAAAPLRPLSLGSDRHGHRFVAYASDPNPWRLWVVDGKARRASTQPSRTRDSRPSAEAAKAAVEAADEAAVEGEAAATGYARGAWVGGSKAALAALARGLDRRGVQERALREAVEAHAVALERRLAPSAAKTKGP
jgi:hypothetical protein